MKVLVTGATGVVGGAFVTELAKRPETEIYLLVRPKDGKDPEARVQALLSRWEGADARFRGLMGDVSLPRLGLSPADYDFLRDRITHVVHAAASVKLDQSEEQARENCVLPLKSVLELIEASGRPHAKLEFVSTVGVLGKSRAPLIEEFFREPRSFHNTYEQAKSEAEVLLEREAKRSGLRFTIHRPSMVVGDSVSGEIAHFQVFSFILKLLSGTVTAGILPRLGEFKLDTVASDWVAKAIRASMESEDSIGKCLNLCSGPHAAIGLGELISILDAEVERSGLPKPDRRFLPQGVIFGALRLAERLAPSKRLRKRATLLGGLFDYLSGCPAFLNQKTLQYLEARGVTQSRPQEYLPVVVRNWLRFQN